MPRHTPYAGVASLFRASLEQGQAAQVVEDGRQRRNFVHVKDVARAVAAATVADLSAGVTPLTIGSPHIITIGEMAEALSAALDGPAPIITGRYRLGDVRHLTADCSAAERILGWQAEIDLTSGIQSLLAGPAGGSNAPAGG
jgi:dTDP-L-rhamnose 4-epimerase